MKPGIINNSNQLEDPFYSKNNFEYIRKNQKKVIVGEGAFAEVYLMKHKKDGNFYAMKQMDKSKLSAGGISCEMIYREILIQRRLNHDNIIKLYSSEEDDNKFYLIMEYAIGGTLFGKIKKSKNGFDEDTAFKYFIQASAAIAFLHENQLFHRDIKPENFLIDANGVVRLCDFGWCRDLNEGQRNTFCGTYEYMAPEIVKDQPYSFPIDIWALGILLYELVHGYWPFRSIKNKDNEDEIIQNIVKYKFKIEKPISKELEDLICKLLTPDHQERLNVFQIFNHPWVKVYEKKYFEMKNKKIEEDKNNFSLLKDTEISKKNTAENDILKQNKINRNIIPPKKASGKGVLDDFSIFTDSVVEDDVKESKNKLVIKSKKKKEDVNDKDDNVYLNQKNDVNQDERNDILNRIQNKKNSSKLNMTPIDEITPNPLNNELYYKQQVIGLDKNNILNEESTIKKSIRYVDYYEN